MNADFKAWADALKPGDKVLVNGSDERIDKVARVTPTMVVVGVNRFRKADGHLVGGGSWSYGSIKPLKPEDEVRLIAIARYRTALDTFDTLANKARNGYRWRQGEGHYTAEQLEAAIAVLKNEANTYEPHPETTVPEVTPV